MAGNYQVTKLYPRLETAWQQNLPAIDEQILDFCETCVGAPSQHLAELQNHIENWIEDQDLDDETLAELEKSRKDPQYLEDKLGKRIGQLSLQGRLLGAATMNMQAGATASGRNIQRGAGGSKMSDGEYPPRYPPEFKPGLPATPHPGEPGEIPTKGPQADRTPREKEALPGKNAPKPVPQTPGKPSTPKAN